MFEKLIIFTLNYIIETFASSDLQSAILAALPLEVSILNSFDLKEFHPINIQTEFKTDVFKKNDLLEDFDIIFDKIFNLIVDLIQYQLSFFSENPLDPLIFQDYNDKFRDKYFNEALYELKNKLDSLNLDEKSNLETYKNIYYTIFFELFVKIYHSLYEEIYFNIQSEFSDKFYFTLYIKFFRVLFPIICYEVDYYLLSDNQSLLFDFLLQFF